MRPFSKYGAVDTTSACKIVTVIDLEERWDVELSFKSSE